MSLLGLGPATDVARAEIVKGDHESTRGLRRTQRAACFQFLCELLPPGPLCLPWRRAAIKPRT